MFGNYETNCPRYACCTMGGMGFLLSTSGSTCCSFFGRKSVGLTPRHHRNWWKKNTYKWWILELLSENPWISISEFLWKNIARTFSKQHQKQAFSSNLSHSLIEFVPFFVLYNDRWVTSTKIHGDHRGIEKSLALLRSSARSMVKIHDNCYFRCSMDHKYLAMAILWQVCWR